MRLASPSSATKFAALSCCVFTSSRTLGAPEAEKAGAHLRITFFIASERCKYRNPERFPGSVFHGGFRAACLRHRRSDVLAPIKRFFCILTGALVPLACQQKTETAVPTSANERNTRNLEVAIVGKPGIDLSGPSGVPDGDPDLVIQITMLPELMLEIGVWDIEATPGPNAPDSSQSCYFLCWTSAVNSRGWWLIKSDVPERLSDGRLRIRLCFPETGDIQNTSAFVLRGLDAQGAVLFERKVALEADNSRLVFSTVPPRLGADL